MSDRATRVLKDALSLSIEERAKLASELIGSLDETVDNDADEQWAIEVERRAKRALSGESKGTDWETVRGRALDKLAQ